MTFGKYLGESQNVDFHFVEIDSGGYAATPGASGPYGSLEKHVKTAPNRPDSKAGQWGPSPLPHMARNLKTN